VCNGYTGIGSLYIAIIAFFDIWLFVSGRTTREKWGWGLLYQDGRRYQQIGVGRVAKRVLASNECVLCCAMTTKEWCQLAQHLTWLTVALCIVCGLAAGWYWSRCDVYWYDHGLTDWLSEWVSEWVSDGADILLGCGAGEVWRAVGPIVWNRGQCYKEWRRNRISYIE